MPRVWSITKLKNETGALVVEVLLAATVLGILVTAVVGAIVYGRSATAGAGDRVRGIFLAEEGIEATRNIGGAAYANLVDGSYGLTQSGVPLTWAFLGSGTSDTSGIYTRQTTVASAGTNRKTITSTVSWAQPGGTVNTSAVARMTNWRAAIKQWSAGILAGSQDVTGTADGIKTFTVGTMAYTVMNATTNNFIITDVTNPAAPTNVRTMTIAGTPTNIKVAGNYAYVTNISDTAELQVVDISVPATASVVASVNMTGTGNGQSLAINGALVYVARAQDATAGANEVTVVNITTPTAPTVSGGYNNATLSMNGMYISGGFAYVPTNSTTQEMLVLSLAVPTTPTLTVAYNAPTAVAAQTITGFGNRVFLGAGTTLSSINITTPSAPAQLGTFTASGTINDLEVDITNLSVFVATTGTAAEFQVVNVTNPAAMSLTRSIDVPGTTSTLGGISYNWSFDFVVGASASGTQEIVVFTRN